MPLQSFDVCLYLKLYNVISNLTYFLQVYVLVNYTQNYGEEIVTAVNPDDGERVTGGKPWGDAYNGTALAGASTCVLISLYIFVTLQQRNGNLYVHFFAVLFCIVFILLRLLLLSTHLMDYKRKCRN